MFYYLYEIKNNVNNKVYVGVHKTDNLDDGYMGSGKILLEAIKKYGIENFSKKILEIFETQEEMYLREKEIVTSEFLAREDTYNLRRGGQGGFDYINSSGIKKMGGKSHSDITKKKLGRLMQERHANGTAPKMTENTKRAISTAKTGTVYKSRPNKTEDHKKKIAVAIKKKWDEKKLSK